MVEIILYKKREVNDFFWFTMNELKKKPISKLMSKVQKNIK
jgi:hypothetical protein